MSASRKQSPLRPSLVKWSSIIFAITFLPGCASTSPVIETMSLPQAWADNFSKRPGHSCDYITGTFRYFGEYADPSVVQRWTADYKTRPAGFLGVVLGSDPPRGTLVQVALRFDSGTSSFIAHATGTGVVPPERATIQVKGACKDGWGIVGEQLNSPGSSENSPHSITRESRFLKGIDGYLYVFTSSVIVRKGPIFPGEEKRSIEAWARFAPFP